MLVVVSIAVTGCASLGWPQLFARAPEPEATAGEADRLRPPGTGLSTLTVEQPLSAARPDAAAGDAGTDLWTRVRRGFALSQVDNDAVRRQVRWYRRYRSHLERTSRRARPYLHHIVEAIEQRRLPAELALLPVIESAFEPFAQSPSGAAGIWQFIPSTGRRYGLRQTWWYDGRRDVVESTRAALDLLQTLHDELGDWLLAIAAYNAGEGTVLEAMKAARSKGREPIFWNLELPAETRTYVPRLLALAEIIADPKAHGVHLEPLPNEPYFDVVELEHPVDMAIVADLSGVGLDELYRLNAGYKRWATGPNRPHRLALPVKRSASLRRRLRDMKASKLMGWKQHPVERGETLAAIAARYGTHVAALEAANRLPRSELLAGSTLLVPAPARPLGEYPLRHGDPPPEGTRMVHVVRPGESLWRIARRYWITVRELTAWNNLDGREVLQPGQRLVLWTDKEKKPAGATPTLVATAKPASGRRVRYVVRPGDSLWDISRRFKVSIGALQQWNGLKDGGLLQPGQTLELYLETPTES